MALARIISNSPLCSRELAINLLERGYAVEIVSPDAIPDNLADLELRVETGPSDVLTANVEARGEKNSATFQFIHQLKLPSLEMKRPLPADELIAAAEATTLGSTIPAIAISANPSPMVGACESIPVSDSALAPALELRIVEHPRVVPEPTNPLPTAVSDPPKKPAAFSDKASVIVMPSQAELTTHKIEEPTSADVAAPANPVFKVIIPKPSLHSIAIPKFGLGDWRTVVGRITVGRSMVSQAMAGRMAISRMMRRIRGITLRPTGWFGWSALGFAGVVALGLTLPWVLRPMGRSSRTAGSGVATSETGSSADGFSFLPPVADESGKNVGQSQIKSSISGQSSVSVAATPRIAPPVSERVGVRSSATSMRPTPAPVPKAHKVAQKPKPVTHSDDVIAPDTITYFNRPGAKPIPVKEFQQRADSRKRGEGVMAVDSAPAKSAANSGSGK